MYTITYMQSERNGIFLQKTTPEGVDFLLFCNGLLFTKQLFDVCHKILAVGNGCDDKRQRRDQNIHGANQPEPGPVFSLTGKFTDGNGLEEAGREDGKESADGLIGSGTPDVRGVLIADVKEGFSVAKGYEAQLRLEYLIKHNEKHHQQ